MGNVTRVRKREHRKGGSAREQNVEHCCLFRLLPSLQQRSPWRATTSSSTSTISLGSSDSTTDQHQQKERRSLHSQPSQLVSYQKKDMVYALKSIHLNRCSSETFRRELENEGNYVGVSLSLVRTIFINTHTQMHTLCSRNSQGFGSSQHCPLPGNLQLQTPLVHSLGIVQWG